MKKEIEPLYIVSFKTKLGSFIKCNWKEKRIDNICYKKHDLYYLRIVIHKCKAYAASNEANWDVEVQFIIIKYQCEKDQIPKY